jgi:hypothetical protein
MLKSVLLSTAALALIATSVDARPQVTLSSDNRFVSVLPHAGQSVPAGHTPGSYVVSTIDKSKVGTYFCCYGSTLSGPSSFFGAAYGVAEQFTPSASASVSELYAGVGYVSGDDKVTLTLYADSGNNSPGKKLTSGTGTATTEFGFCCNLVKAKIKSTSLTGGTPYWVAITVGGSDFDAAGRSERLPLHIVHHEWREHVGHGLFGNGVQSCDRREVTHLSSMPDRHRGRHVRPR